jgi:hypothetical protein
VDFILCNTATLKVETESSRTYQLSDHDLVYTYIPLYTTNTHHRLPTHTTTHTTPSHHPTQHTTADQPSSPHISTPPEDKIEEAEDRREKHYWIEGKCVAEYMNSAKIWKAHTSSTTFAEGFNKIIKDYEHDNDLRTSKVEDFLILEAQTAGVIKSSIDR